MPGSVALRRNLRKVAKIADRSGPPRNRSTAQNKGKTKATNPYADAAETATGGLACAPLSLLSHIHDQG